MTQKILPALAVAAALGLSACGPAEEPKQQTAEPGGAAPAQQGLSDKAGAPVEQDLSDKAVAPAQQSLSDKAVAMAREATQAAGEKIEAAATAAAEAAGAAKETVSATADAALEKGGTMAQTAADKATGLIQQVKDYSAESKIDLAESLMEQLRALRDLLPQGLQEEIAKLEAMLSSEQSQPAPSAN